MRRSRSTAPTRPAPPVCTAPSASSRTSARWLSSSSWPDGRPPGGGGWRSARLEGLQTTLGEQPVSPLALVRVVVHAEQPADPAGAPLEPLLHRHATGSDAVALVHLEHGLRGALHG